MISTAPPSSEASVPNSQERPTSRAHIAFAPVSGEIRPIALVSDNGPCFKAVRFAAFIQKRPELIHNENIVWSRARTGGEAPWPHLSACSC